MPLPIDSSPCATRRLLNNHQVIHFKDPLSVSAVMPSRSSNTLGRFLAATACLTKEEIMASPLPFLAEDASDEDDYNDDEDDEEPHLANITLESDMSEPESPSEKNLSMEVQLGDSFVLDNNKEEDNQGRVEESHVTLPPLDLNEATQVCIPLEEGLLQMDLLECRTVENRRIGSIYCHSTVNHGSLGLLRYLSQVYGANNDWRHVTILNVGAGPGVVGLGVAALSHGKAAVAMSNSGALPKVAFNNPPIVPLVCMATCSVTNDSRSAQGTSASPARQKQAVCETTPEASATTASGPSASALPRNRRSP